MPKFHTVYITKLGVPYIEEAQEYETEQDAAIDASNCFTPQRDEKGNYHHVPVAVTTVENRTVILTDVDHITVMTPEELASAREAEKRQQAEMFAGDAGPYPFTE